MEAWQQAVQRATEEGFRPAAIAKTADGVEVVLISYPITDGYSISVLARTRPDDPESWEEFSIEELMLQPALRTPT